MCIKTFYALNRYYHLKFWSQNGFLLYLQKYWLPDLFLHATSTLYLFLFLFIYLFLVALWCMEFLGQESDPNCKIVTYCHSNARYSLTHHAGLGVEAASQHSRDATDTIVPQQELLI